MSTSVGGKLLPTKHAAEHAHLSPGTLQNLRVSGEGPAFYKVRGRVYYDPQDIDVWLSAKRVTSTAQKVQA